MKVELSPDEAQGWLDMAREGAAQMARIAVIANRDPAVAMDRYAAMAHKLATAAEADTDGEPDSDGCPL